ncbi:hypothetical protein [Paenibacillus sp. CFBP 13594]|nr:hypothetical protein [Paenibacillus sp. CFBP 13594]
MEHKLSKEKMEQIIGRELTKTEYEEVVGTVLIQLLHEQNGKSNG